MRELAKTQAGFDAVMKTVLEKKDRVNFSTLRRLTKLPPDKFNKFMLDANSRGVVHLAAAYSTSGRAAQETRVVAAKPGVERQQAVQRKNKAIKQIVDAKIETEFGIKFGITRPAS